MPAWNEGGKEESLDRMEIQMTHDELLGAIGEAAAAKIAEAGFVLVPRKWREDVFRTLDALGAERRAASGKSQSLD